MEEYKIKEEEEFIHGNIGMEACIERPKSHG
jgi:hypothetical protein